MTDQTEVPRAIGAEDALTHPDPIVRIIARGSLSKWIDVFQAWVNEEFARCDDRLDVLHGISRLLVMTHSSIAANMMKEGGFPTAAEALKLTVDEVYVSHAEQCRISIQAVRRGR